MKIINAANPGQKPLSRDEFLEREIERLQIETGVYDSLKEAGWRPLTLAAKESDYEALQIFQRRIEMEEKVEMTQQHSSFSAFTLLPAELRIRIWDYVLDDHCHTRVHCIDESRSRFISNQPLSPLLHACHESRTRYLGRTRNTFAFETFLNFERDVFYLIDFDDIDDWFPRFLTCESVHQIRTLAMPSSLYCDLPLPSEPMFQAYYTMRLSMAGWKETLIVFEDERDLDTVWKDQNIAFRELSARQKRKRAERGYARYYGGVVNRAMERRHGISEPMLYRFVFSGSSDDPV